jgi:hypothetical protein
MRKVFPGLENVFAESSPILTRCPENCTGIRPSSIVDSNAPMMPIIASFITRYCGWETRPRSQTHI